MPKDNIVVGLEIGTSKVCTVVAELGRDGTVKILGVGEAPSRGVRKGEIVDPETCGKCVRESLADAEEKSDVMIKSVFLGVSGAHICGFNNRGTFTLPEDRDMIEDSDLDAVQTVARSAPIPSQNMFLHTILQHYYVDGQEGVLNPIGLYGRKLEADYHIIHGVGNRIRNSIQCVKDLDLEVDDIVFNPFAAAQVVLDPNQKQYGSLMVDIGGGTTGYMIYVDGAVKQSGVLALGGDHITNDLSLGLRIPMAKAEQLKVEEGSCILGESVPGQKISIRDDHGFAGKDIERETLNTIIHMRIRETFELLKRQIQHQNYLDFLGAGMILTGGTSQMKGIKTIAEDVFGIPAHLCRAQNVSGITSAFENPQYSTAIGLTKYAQATYEDEDTGIFTKLKKILTFGMF